ncbi:MAG: sulfur carrier protein ThiS [Leptospira sp.]|nr:sulfur carrier protein ThiS [Leptospira sp.]
MIVNGKEISLESVEIGSLNGLLSYLNINPATVAIERNGLIEDREKWESLKIASTDRIEIIKFIGGG